MQKDCYKKCSSCCRTLPVTGFYKKRAAHDGYQCFCKRCDRAKSKAQKKKQAGREIIKFPENKICRKCGVDKRACEFPVNRSLSDGLHSYCTQCSGQMCLFDAAKNKLERAAKSRAYFHSNKERRSAYAKGWRQGNKYKVCAYAAERRFSRRQQTPAWANLKKIERIYELAAWASKYTDENLHVDHIDALRAKDRCGLHVEYNLQILTQTENLKKYNHVI